MGAAALQGRKRRRLAEGSIKEEEEEEEEDGGVVIQRSKVVAWLAAPALALANECACSIRLGC